MTDERDVLEVDVLFVGGGIASLSGALHLSNLIAAHNKSGAGQKLGEVGIAILEKGFSPGAHGISGAVMDPGPLKELVLTTSGEGRTLEAK
jgi:electron-transferring-flavoprotein dehydrogenase